MESVADLPATGVVNMDSPENVTIADHVNNTSWQFRTSQCIVENILPEISKTIERTVKDAIDGVVDARLKCVEESLKSIETKLDDLVIAVARNGYRVGNKNNLPNRVHEFKMAMTCEGCASAAKRVLGKLEKIASVETDVDKKQVLVTSSLPSEDLLEALKKTGKEVSYVGVK